MVVAALWGTKRRSRCRELVLTLFAKGHLVDPLQNAAYQSLMQLRRMAEQRPDAFVELKRVWRRCANGGKMCDGPVATAHSILQGMGWHWQAPSLLMREERPHLGLLDEPERWWHHEIRQGLRLADWRKAGNRRIDMRGIESTAGIDKLATTKAMNSTKIPPECELLCGCVWTQKRQFDCTFSGGVRVGKRFAVSSKLQATVTVHLEMWYLSADMGPSTRAHSISCSVLSDERFESETKINDCVVAWTVGACVCNQDARFRRAGCGVFFGINDDRNCSFTLPGREQTNNSAEVLAVVAAMHVHDGNLEIRSDSEYVVCIATSRTRGET